jgi:MoaA/NifB/PqqE/SkfB family radical SAM enzyme
MEPRSQVEIQLGHMCNNRCVFCVSGQETALGRALPLEIDPVLERLREARALGQRKLTLLGGEPTLQPGFFAVVQEAVRLGFEEIVLFTNGVKTARGEFIDEILATGGNFTWRLSFQGASREAHERTTKKDGSFARLERTLANLRDRNQRVTVNMCVVTSNYESVAAFPGLLLPFGVQQLHLDMMRPLDAGVRTPEELAATIPRYGDMVPALTEMARGFPAGFDLNIGNLPYCIAPGLAGVIHHDGEPTMTVSVDGQSTLSRPWNKYLTKRRDKLKPESCRRCAFDHRCSGVFETYARLHGLGELVPLTAEDLPRIDPERRLLALHLAPLLAPLLAAPLPAPFATVEARETGDTEQTVTLAGPGLDLAVRLGPPGPGFAGFDRCSLQLVRSTGPTLALRAGLEHLWSQLAAGSLTAIHPLGDDALRPAARTVAARLGRLRAAAPFGELAWRSVILSADGYRAEARLEGPGGEAATLWLGEQQGQPTGGYRIDQGPPTPALVAGLRLALQALGVSAPRAAASP